MLRIFLNLQELRNRFLNHNQIIDNRFNKIKIEFYFIKLNIKIMSIKNLIHELEQTLTNFFKF
jgi:hypothetical protein